jgi:dolichyl-phosphate beta-glucosyltransferase
MPVAPKLSLIIPAYNEERRLGPTLEKVGAYLRRRRLPYELLVVDDGSHDGTAALVLAARRRLPALRLLRNGHNQGKGASVRHGVMQARAPRILFSDADLSTPIEELEKLEPALLAGADFAIGSRGMRRSRVEVRQPFYRMAMGKGFNLLVQVLAVPGVMDTQCGFKLFTRVAGQKVLGLQRVPRFGFDVEMLYLARKLGFHLSEIPVRWVNSPLSTVNPIADSSQMFFDLLQIRLNDWQGKYNGEA